MTDRNAPQSAASMVSANGGGQDTTAPRTEQEAAPRSISTNDPDADGRLCVAMIVHHWGAERLGGAERQLESLIPLMRNRGLRPVIICRATSDAPTEDEPIEVIRIRVPKLRGVGAPVFIWQAQRVLRRLDPDVVHAFGAFAQSTVALLYKRSTGTPFITKILRSGSLGDLHRLAAKPFGRQRRRALLRRADAFVAISAEIDAELAALDVDPERRLRIPNGVDLERFRPVAPETRAAERSAIGCSGRVVVAVGRLSPEKRLRELSERWVELRASHPDVTLAVFGKLINRVDPERVTLADVPGVLRAGARPDIERAYQAADIYVSASIAEGLSNALLEAMASGLPCVVTDVGGVRDLIESGDNGIIVQPDDLDGLLAEIAGLLDDPDRARQLGERARTTVAATHGLDVVADELAAAYRRIAGSARR